MILYNFKCSKGHEFEEMVSSDVREIDCDTCGATAKRLVSTPRAVLEGISGDFPDAAAKWERLHQKQRSDEIHT